jgi:hypothetical protein
VRRAFGRVSFSVADASHTSFGVIVLKANTVKVAAMIAVRRAVIFVAQIMALISIVVATTVGALVGGDWLGNIFPALAGAVGALAGTRGMSILGAIAGFFISTILVALFFCASKSRTTREIHLTPDRFQRFPSADDILIEFKAAKQRARLS